MICNHALHDIDMVAVYALGALAQKESSEIAAIIKECSECAKEYEALRLGASSIGWTAELPIGSTQGARPQVKAAIMQAIKPTAIPSIAPNAASRRVWLAYGAAAAAVVLAIFSFISNATMRSELAALRDRNGSMASRIATSDRRIATDRRLFAALLSPDAQHFAVANGDVVRYEGTLLVAMRRLPPLPRGKVYQTWTLAKGATTMSPSITFVPNAKGWAFISLPVHASDVVAVALSVEPEGGSKAPTTKPVFVRPLG